MQNAPREHSAILSTFIKLPFVIKILVLSIFEWPFYTSFTVIILHYEVFSCHGLYNFVIDYFSSFQSILPHVQMLWELVLTGEVRIDN